VVIDSHVKILDEEKFIIGGPNLKLDFAIREDLYREVKTTGKQDREPVFRNGSCEEKCM